MSQRLFREMGGQVARASSMADGGDGDMRALTRPDGDSAAPPEGLIVEGN